MGVKKKIIYLPLSSDFFINALMRTYSQLSSVTGHFYIVHITEKNYFRYSVPVERQSREVKELTLTKSKETVIRISMFHILIFMYAHAYLYRSYSDYLYIISALTCILVVT